MKKTDKTRAGDFVTLMRLYFSIRNGNKNGVSVKAWRERRHFKCQASAWVSVQPEIAFDYITNITRHNEWATDEIKVTQLTPGPVRLGSEFSSIGIQGGREWPSHLVVTQFERPQLFEFTATGGPIAAPQEDPHRHEFLLTPKNMGTLIEVCKTDPAPENWPNLQVRFFTPLASLTMGNRYFVMRNLQECINNLGQVTRQEVYLE